jgi:ArpU family phage transcriptional regulator
MKIKDKYYKSVEKLLYNYNMLKINIEILNQQLEELKEEEGMKGVAYDDVKISETNKFHSQTEDTAINNIELEELINKKKEKLQSKLDMLNKLTEGLNEVEREIIRMYYIEGKQWWQIAYEVKYSERHCRRIRAEAIGKLAVGLYGEEVLEMSV